MKTFNVGDYVYKPFQPQNPGKVVNVFVKTIHHPTGPHDYDYCSVRFLDGKLEEIWEAHLKSFNRLIADHQKKLNTHLTTLAKLNAL